MKAYAMSIVYPAVKNILIGSKRVEIRSWKPFPFPLRDLVLVENYIYLKNGEADKKGMALAMVDILKIYNWTIADYHKMKPQEKLGKIWKPGYFCWEISNVRPLSCPMECIAKKGIYEVNINSL